MKVGDIVVLIKHDKSLDNLRDFGNKIPVKDVYYTVRDAIMFDNYINIRLEEIINTPKQYGNNIFMECIFKGYLFSVVDTIDSDIVEELVEESCCVLIEKF